MTTSIIVPYRNREDHLRKFLSWYTGKLPDFRIVIVEQNNDLPFNRGWLLNVGFHLAVSDQVVFHDVDMIAVNGIQHYKKPVNKVAQLATHVEQFGYRMPFPEYLGGVTKYDASFFSDIDGYSNDFSGWGGEDNEMYDNVTRHAVIEYRNCWHISLPHERTNDSFCLPKDHPNYIQWKEGRKTGLSNCSFVIDLKYEFGNVTHLLASMPDTLVSPRHADESQEESS